MSYCICGIFLLASTILLVAVAIATKGVAR